ncbi:MAG: ATP-binding protein [Thiolinea sp.]
MPVFLPKLLLHHKRLFFLFLLVFVAGFPVVRGEGEQPQKILILNAYHKGFPWTDNLVRGIESVLLEPWGTHPSPDLMVEYMDSKAQVYDPHYQAILFNLYRHKYADTHFSAIICSDDNALSFLRSHHQVLFPNTPIIFSGINNADIPKVVDKRVFTGIMEVTDERDTLKLMLDLHPQTKQILVIADNTPTGEYRYSELKKIMPGFPQLTFTRLDSHYSLQDVQERVGVLDDSTLILFATFYRDKNNQYYSLTDGLRRISRASSRPLYGLHRQLLGHGIVGGRLLDGYTHGQRTGRIARKVLNGISPEAIPISTSSASLYMFDHIELERWGIQYRDLPSNSVIINQPFSFYETYKTLIWMTIAIIAFLVIALLGILFGLIKTYWANQKIRHNEENLRITLNSIGDAVMVVNMRGYIKRMNPVASQLTGWSFSEAKDSHLDEVFRIRRDAAEQQTEVKAFRQLLKQDRVLADHNTPLRLCSKRNDEYLIAASGFPILDEEERQSGIVLVFRNISEEIRLQEHMRHGQKMEAIGHLAGGIAHDFNNLINGISVSAKLLEVHLETDEEGLDYLQIIQQSSQHATDLVSKLLTFARKKPVVFKALNIHDVLTQTVHLLEATHKGKIQIRLQLMAERHYVSGDFVELQSAFLNLAINAVHAMPDGGTLSLTTRDYSRVVGEMTGFSVWGETKADKGWIEILIRDTGTGIEPQHLPHIFEPFYSTKKTGEGSGLGLSTAHGCITHHRGSIQVSSEQGKGTLFILALPTVNRSEAEEVSTSGAMEKCSLLENLEDRRGLATDTAM